MTPREESDRFPRGPPAGAGRCRADRDGSHGGAGSRRQPRELPGTFRHSYSRDRAQLLRRLSRIEGQVRGIRPDDRARGVLRRIFSRPARLRAAVDAVTSSCWRTTSRGASGPRRNMATCSSTWTKSSTWSVARSDGRSAARRGADGRKAWRVAPRVARAGCPGRSLAAQGPMAPVQPADPERGAVTFGRGTASLGGWPGAVRGGTLRRWPPPTNRSWHPRPGLRPPRRGRLAVEPPARLPAGRGPGGPRGAACLPAPMDILGRTGRGRHAPRRHPRDGGPSRGSSTGGARSSISRRGPFMVAVGADETDDAGRLLGSWLDAHAPRSAARRAASPAAPHPAWSVRGATALPGATDATPPRPGRSSRSPCRAPVASTSASSWRPEITAAGGLPPGCPFRRTDTCWPRLRWHSSRAADQRALAELRSRDARAARVHVDGRARAADAAHRHRWATWTCSWRAAISDPRRGARVSWSEVDGSRRGWTELVGTSSRSAGSKPGAWG